MQRALFGFAVLASVAAALVFGFALYLFAAGYSGGSDPQSISALAFPLSFLVVIVVGVPTSLVSALAWAGYLAAARRSRRPAK